VLLSSSLRLPVVLVCGNVVDARIQRRQCLRQDGVDGCLRPLCKGNDRWASGASEAAWCHRPMVADLWPAWCR
jgi:hypothetical protein